MELSSDCYNGWYKETCPENNININIVQNQKDLISGAKLLFTTATTF